jgi:predicted methyltransferase
LIVLSHYQTRRILQFKGARDAAAVSLDLGLSESEISLQDKGVIFPGGDSLTWKLVSRITKNENNCFLIKHGEAVKIQEYSETHDRLYTLYPTENAPTMLVSGLPMHRIKGITPWQDTQSKLKAFGKTRGHILDTATGLGYTAILASLEAAMVTTIELDHAAQVIAGYNPWSRKLFHNPKITQIIGDTCDLIKEFNDETFYGIIHDPPVISLAGEMYSKVFYQQAYRVLTTNGKMFHYVGNPQSRSGARTTRGVAARLQEAGFTRIFSKPEAYGLLAVK